MTNKCTHCPLAEREGQYNYFYKENSDYLIITSYPHRSELKTQIPSILQGSTKQLFQHVIKKAGIDINNISFATLTKCMPKKRTIANKQTKQNIRTCVENNLIPFIQKVNPKIIILLNNDCSKYFLNKSKLESIHGQLFYWQNIKMIATYHPNHLARATYKVERTIDDFSYAKALINEDKSVKDLTLRQVKNDKQFDKALEILSQYNKFGCDVETTNRQPYKDGKIFGMSFAVSDTEAYYFPIRQHSILGDSYRFYWSKEQMNRLKKFVENRNNKFTFHFSNFDTEFIQVDLEWDIRAANDSLNLAYTLNENRKKSLEYLTNHYFPDLVGFKEESKKEIEKTKDFDKIPLDILAKRCSIDSIACFRLTNKFTKELYTTNKELYNYYERFRKPLLQTFVDLQKTGFKIDLDRVDKLEIKYTKKMKHLKRKMWNIAGKRFNPRSAPQLREVLYDDFGLEPPEGYVTEKTNEPQMNKDVFEILKEQYDLPILNHISNYKEVSKLKSTYVDGFRKSVVNGRIHPTFRSSVTDTGRSSSQNPNAQNIASDKDIKGLVIAPKGYNIIEMDYKQAEARLFAYLANSKKLAEVCYASDVYQKIAAMSEKKPFDEITKEVRDHYKMVVLALLYGMGNKALAQTIGKTAKQAKKLRDKFFNMFPAVEQWKREIISELKETGEVTSIYGRKRRLPLIYSSKEDEIAKAKRKAVNFMVQSPTFDYVSVGLRRVKKAIQKFDARMILTVHDSILIEVAENQTSDILPVMKKEMIKPVPPIDEDAHMGVDAEVGKRWGYLEEVEI